MQPARQSSLSRVETTAVVFAIAGAAGSLLEGWLVARGRVPWPGGSRPLIAGALTAGIGLVGGLAGMAWLRRTAGSIIATVAGALSVIYDLGAPLVAVRMLPGVLLLAAGATGSLALALRKDEPWTSAVASWLASLALILHVVVGGLMLPLGLVAPPIVWLGLLTMWAVLLAVALRWRTRHPWRVVAVPPVTVTITAAVLVAGDALLGWAP